MVEEEKVYYFKSNVRHSFSVRFFKGDRDGGIVNALNPIVEVEEKNLKVFRQVNKNAILQGLLVEVDAPDESWETFNALTDEDIDGMIGSIAKVRKAIPTVDSLPILYKMLDTATEKNVNKTIVKLIEDRIEEVNPTLTDVLVSDRNLMSGTYDEK